MGKATYIIIKEKRQKSVEIFYRRYGKKLLAYAIKNWNTDEDTAWELIYKTFDAIIEKINRYSFDSEKKFSSFVLSIFLNNLRNHLRNQKKNISFISDSNMDNHANISNAEEDMEDSEQMTDLKNALAELQDWERMLLLLRAQKMPYADIANYVDKPKEQLKVYHARLKQKITVQLNQKKEVYHG